MSRSDRESYVDASIALRAASDRVAAQSGALSRTAWRTLLAVIAEVSAYSRIWDRVTDGQLSIRAGMSTRSVREGLKELDAAGILVVDRKLHTVSLAAPVVEDMHSIHVEDMSSKSVEDLSATLYTEEVPPGSIPEEESPLLAFDEGVDDRLEGDIAAPPDVVEKYLAQVREILGPRPGSREWVAEQYGFGDGGDEAVA